MAGGRRIAHLALCLAAGLGPACALASADIPTRPLGAVRSLHHIQDQVARGDATAFQVQPGTLRIVDDLLAAIASGAFADSEHRHAVLAYAVSGGNPSTFASLYEAMVGAIDDEAERAIADAVGIALLGRGVSDDPRADPLAIGGMLGAGLALLNGINAEDARARIDRLGEAVLLAPGTLVEESALRRLMPLHAQAGDHAAFLTAASRYVRTFVGSPYASDFAATLVRGGVALTRRADHERLAEIIGFMPAAHRRSIVARQMRAAAVSGNFDLVRFLEARFASEIGARGTAGAAQAPPPDPQSAPRRRLYALMANIASADHAAIAAQLDAIDARALPQADRRLLEAARAVLRDMTRPGGGAGGLAPEAGPAAPAVPIDASRNGDAAAFGLPMQPRQDDIRTVLPGYGAAAEPVAPPRPAPASAAAPEGVGTLATGEDVPAEHRDFVSNTREMLREVESVLEVRGR